MPNAKPRFTLALLSCLLPAGQAIGAETPGVHVRAAGVSSYEIRQEENGRTVSLLDEHGLEVATLSVSHDTKQGVLARFETLEGARFSLTWSSNRGEVSLLDEATSLHGRSRFDVEDWTWVPDREMELLFDGSRPAVTLLLAALADTDPKAAPAGRAAKSVPTTQFSRAWARCQTDPVESGVEACSADC